MRCWCLAGIFLVAACGEASSGEKNEARPVQPPLQPISLSTFERNAPVTLERARSQRAARDLEARAKRALEPILFDPFSARFRNLRSGRGGAVCGQYNAKNRMGAYVGFRDFVVGRDGRAVWTSNYNDGLRSDLFSGFAEAYANACATRSEQNDYRIANRPLDYDIYDSVPAYEPGPTDGARDAFRAAEGGYENFTGE